jgi:hypothetical protein
MDQPDRTTPSGNSASLWLLLSCSAIALAVAVIPCANLLVRRSPVWIAIAAGLAVFPVLPLLWHGVAEATAGAGRAAPLSGRTRLALRGLAVAAVVLAVSLVNLGPSRLFEQVGQLAARLHLHRAAKQEPLLPAVAAFGLERFIPADATLAVGLAGSTAVQQLFAAHGVDTREKLAALATCKIDFVSARVLIAIRGGGARMIVVRAPGITEERNLYCLVGVMGPDRLQVGNEAGQGAKVVHVKGWSAQPMTFRILDESTMIATDQAWQASADKKLFGNDVDAAPGPLAVPLGRLRLTGPLWVASVNESPQGTWDLAVDSRQEGDTFKLQGSATPPSGAKDRATISVSVPLAFASALPERAAALGARGVMTAITATAASGQ